MNNSGGNHSEKKYESFSESQQEHAPQSPLSHEIGELPGLQPIPDLPMTPEEIVSKLDELVKFALECEKQEIAQGISFTEVFKELQEVQKSVHLLSEFQKETMKALTEIAQQEGYTILPEEEALSVEDKKIISHLKSLTTVCEAARDRIHTEMSQNPDVQNEVTKSLKDVNSSDEKKQRRRKNKFRSLGQDGWMPL